LCLESRANQVITGEDNRRFVEAMLWLGRTGAPRRNLPAEFGEWNSVFRRFSRWAKRGAWSRILKRVSRDPDLESLIIDATIIRAHQHAAGAKGEFERRRRGRLSTKIQIAAGALGNPLSLILTPGQPHDCTQAEAIIEGFATEHVIADKAYDTDWIRAYLAFRTDDPVALATPRGNAHDKTAAAFPSPSRHS
jgi:transposase